MTTTNTCKIEIDYIDILYTIINMSLEDLQALLKEGFDTLEYRRHSVENGVGIFETVPLDDSLWICVRLKETTSAVIGALEKEYTEAIPLSTPPMRTSFYERKVHSFLPHTKTLKYYVMNSASA